MPIFTRGLGRDFWLRVSLQRASLSSQTDTTSGRGDALRVGVCLLGMWAMGGDVVAMLGVRTTDLW